MFRSIRNLPAVFAVLVLALLSLSGARISAQNPTQNIGAVALPNTMSTLAGASPMSATAGTECPNLPAGTVSTDAYGDGCLALNGIFGAAGRGGVQVDSFGNVFVADDVDGVIHIINASSGIMTKIAGGGSACSASAGKVDSSGDGCVAATNTTAAGERGLGIDPWGNIFLPGYSDHLVRMICRTASPLCTPAQVGYSELVAGCVTTSGSGTSGVGSDNVQAAQTGIATCAAANGEVDTPRGVTADLYGNVYFAETASYRFRVVLGPQTSSYFSGTNPLWAALAAHYPSLTQGYAYTVVDIGGNTTSPASGSACTETVNGTTYNGTALDAYGDGCPLDFSSVSTSSSSYVQGVAADAAGNLVFTDPGHGALRVFFVNGTGTAGALMAAAIAANNPGVTPQPGFVYRLAGGGSSSLSSTPKPGNSVAALDASIFKVTVSPQGNIFIGDSNRVLFFDIRTGYLRTLFTGSANVAAGGYCSGGAGQTSLNAYSDGCPAADSLFTNSNGLGLATDGAGNVYLYDAASNTSGMLVRKALAQGLAGQTLGKPLTQSFVLHLSEAGDGMVSGAGAALSGTADMTAGTPACVQNGDYSADCTVAVTATPTAAGLRSAALTVTLTGSGWETPATTIALNGNVAGAALAADNASATANGTAIATATATSTILSGIVPGGVALDGAGNVYAVNASGGSIVASTTNGTVTVAEGLTATPAQIAVDATGDVFAAIPGAPQIAEWQLTGAPDSYTALSIGYTPANGGTAVPSAVAVDAAGSIFVADNQGASANNAIYRLSSVAGAEQVAGSPQSQVTVATGFESVSSLAVAANGSIFVADKGAGAVYKLTPGVTGSYTQSTVLSGIAPVAVAVDAAGDVYVQDESSESVMEVPASGPATVTVLTGLVSPVGLAVDGKGTLYSADASNAGITQVARGAATYSFANESTTYAATLTNVGNLAATGTNSNATDFDFSTSAANSCNFASAVAAGEACTLSATLGYGSGAATDTLTLVPATASASVGSLTLSGTLTQIATTTTISAPVPANPTTSTGAIFTVTVAPASGTTAPSGNVTVTVAQNGAAVSSYTPALSPSGANGTATVNVSGLAVGQYTITASYAPAANGMFAASSGNTVSFNMGAPTAPTITTLTLTSASTTYGGTIAGSVTVVPQSGTGTPTGTVTFYSGTNALGACVLSGGGCSFTLAGVPAGVQTLVASYGGDGTYSAGNSNGATIVIARAILQITANSYTIPLGSALPAYAATFTGFVNNDTQASAVSGQPAITSTATAASGVGVYPISISTGSLYTPNYNFLFTPGYLHIVPIGEAAAVATGDMRSVTEPVIPAICATLNASIAEVDDDIPTSVDATNTNPDGARIQAALNQCAGAGQAVELSAGGAGNDAFLSGPLTMPSNVTLLVDPGVVLFFSRNVQDYDTTPGTHTCGTVNSDSATSSCLPLIGIPGTSTNASIMGYGKLDGRGGDVLLNAFPASYAGQSWWGLSAIANSGGNQQNPRFVQIDTGASNVTLYKITLRNSPLFHISSTGAMTGFTAWDIKIVTPTTARNTDGIDPGNAQNVTITRSWISDGDDNVAVGAANSVPSANISVTNNHFFAGHGESIGSYTQAGVSNVLFDGNMSWGNSSVDTNSTGIRIKSAYDRGGVVSGIQYSNSCYQDHKTLIQFTPVYESNAGTNTPNYNNILLQNLTFLTEGTVQFTGSSNNGVVYPFQGTLDNVSFTTLATTDFVTNGSEGDETNAELTYGPGEVSSNFISGWATFVGSNGDTATNNITATALYPPACSFTAIAPELTGPNGLPQTIAEGENATAVVILTPAVGGSAYPTGTVTLTDALTGDMTTVTLPGTTDTIEVPLSGLSVGTHTFTASYSGDANYVPQVSGSPYTVTGPYVVTVNAGSLAATSTTLSGVPASTPYGTSFTATATVSGSNPTGTVSFLVNGVSYAASALVSGTASATISLPYSATPYSIVAVYSGDIANAGSTSAASSLTVSPATTTTALTANATTATLGHPVLLTATVASGVGIPTGSVNFSYTTAASSTPVALTTGVLTNGSTTVAVDLPIGADSVTASYIGSGSFAASSSTPATTITVNAPVIAPASSLPIALPVTMTTIAGGAAANCSAASDNYGNGCPATSIIFFGSLDLRSVVADPWGNVYLTDAVASQVRRIAPNGIITNFAGNASGTTCTPTATTGCVPTEVKLNKPRGIAADAAGNIYIAGYSDNQVFKVSASNGLLYLVAGTGTAGTPTATNGDGGAAASATLDQPRGVWADALGDVYIADTSDNKIREVSTAGTIQTIAGTGTAASTGDGGPASAAAVDNPQGVLTDANLNVYIADSSGGRIRVICVTCGTNSPLDHLLAQLGIAAPQNGYIYTIAGGGSSSFSGPYPATPTSVSMSPQKLAVDLSGNLYISDSDGAIWFLDATTGYIRPIAGDTKTNCASATDSYGDGCAATQAVIGDGGNGIGVGVDALGNLYISDTLNARIRKVTTGLAAPATATVATATQPVTLHFVAGDQLAAANGLSLNTSEWSLSTPACTTNADTTTDCQLNVSFTPAVPGARTAPLAVTSANGNTAYLELTGTGLGAAATLDPASQTSFGTGLAVRGIATDNTGNIYVTDANSGQLLRFAASAAAQGAGATPTPLATFTAPAAVAVDARGFVYVSDTSAGTVTAVSPAGQSAALPFQYTTPSALAVDALNNLYVADAGTQTIYQVDPITGVEHTLPVGTLVTPSGLGIDAAGNLLVADTAQILAVPASPNSAGFQVASLAPQALAIDAGGNLYTGANGGVLKLNRTQGYVQFAAVTPATVNLLESGNQPAAFSSIVQSDTADYSLTAAASADCTVSSGATTNLAPGGACVLTANYTPTTFLTTTDTVSFSGNLALPASLTLTGPAMPPASQIALGAISPAAPVYGQSVTVSATVTGSTITPTGTVVFTVDGNTISVNLTNGGATTTLTGLNAGTHSVSAAYTSSNGFASSSTAAVSFTVAQAATSVIASASPNPAPQGKPVTLSATVSGLVSGTTQPTGTVVFTAGSTTLCSATLGGTGTASCSFTPASSGTLAITAQYQGDANHLGASAGVSLSVYDAAVTLTLASTQLTYPGATNVTACVTGATSATTTGTIEILDGATVLTTQTLQGGGCAYWYISPALAAGSHSITAVYSGDKNNPAGISLPTVVTVSPVPSNLSASCWNSSFPYGGNYQCTVNVSGNAGSALGSITYTLDGGAAVAVPLSNGNAQFTITKPAVGSHTVVIGYAQQTNYAAAAPATETFTVTPAN
jgi:hypothetical protein